MNVLLTIRRLVATAALSGVIATAQSVPGPVSVPVTPGQTSDSAPVVLASPAATPVDAGAAPAPSLEFKPPAQETSSPPAQKNVSVPVKPPVPVPGGPKVIDNAVAPQEAPPQEAAPESHPVASLPPAGANGRKPGKPYVLGPLDVVEVRVWNDAKLSGIFDIGTDGNISMPLVGQVAANGLTAAELTGVIKQKLSAVIIEPEVNVQVLRNNSKKFTILGGCGRTGEFPLVGDITVLDALASCGGFKEFSNLKKIYVLRGGKQLKFNYRDVIKGKNMDQNITLENGDRIVVPDN